MIESNRASQISSIGIAEPPPASQRRGFRDHIALAAVVILLLTSGYVGSQYTQRLRIHYDLVESSHKILGTLDILEYQVTAAESEQRGYLLTGSNEYLERFDRVISKALDTTKEVSLLVRDNPIAIENVAALEGLIKQKAAELAVAVEARHANSIGGVRLIADESGKSSIDAVRRLVDQVRIQERSSMDKRASTASMAYFTSLVVGITSTAAGLVLVLSVVYLLQHNRRRAEAAAESISAEHARLQASLERIRKLETDNKELNQYMRSFVEQVEDYAIFAMDENCRATTWNNGVLKVLGFEEVEFIGQDVRKLIFVPEAIELGIPQAEFESAALLGSASDDRWMMRKGGRRFWASGITSSVKDDRGLVVGYSKVMRDLTDKKRDEDELAELASKYSDANRRMSEFLATLAHELRNPLAPIRNALDLMAMSATSSEDEELRIVMDRQVSQLIRLLDDLLDISRIGRGKIVLQRSIVDMRTVIESAVEASGMLIKEKDQQLNLDICQEDVWVNIDSARITQVVCNLLNNASRYSDEGCVIKLSLKVDHKSSELGLATLTVEDNGIGISSDRLSEIFQMFAQVDDSLGRGQTGLGIGLTLVKTLVELHRGTVVAESDGIGKGSLFTVCIPLASPDTDMVVEEPAKEWPICDRTFQVLVVEDMRALRTIMARLLEKLGHRVHVAEDGLAALESITQVKPDVIFSDISMPGMTGYDLAKLSVSA
jgi:PAS domain S-box-containing protein